MKMQLEKQETCSKTDRKVKPVVAVAQLVESRIVIPVVVGSNPISHPIISSYCANTVTYLFCGSGEIGRRTRFRFWRPRRESSSLSFRTMI